MQVYNMTEYEILPTIFRKIHEIIQKEKYISSTG